LADPCNRSFKVTSYSCMCLFHCDSGLVAPPVRIHSVGILMPLSAGDRLGPYEILSPIGEGGMGEVWEARDTRLDRIVALEAWDVAGPNGCAN